MLSVLTQTSYDRKHGASFDYCNSWIVSLQSYLSSFLFLVLLGRRGVEQHSFVHGGHSTNMAESCSLFIRSKSRKCVICSVFFCSSHCNMDVRLYILLERFFGNLVIKHFAQSIHDKMFSDRMFSHDLFAIHVGLQDLEIHLEDDEQKEGTVKCCARACLSVVVELCFRENNNTHIHTHTKK